MHMADLSVRKSGEVSEIKIPRSLPETSSDISILPLAAREARGATFIILESAKVASLQGLL